MTGRQVAPVACADRPAAVMAPVALSAMTGLLQMPRVHDCTLTTGISRTKEFEKKGLASFSINVGAKCGHDCWYCSTGAMLRMHPSFKQANENPFEHGYAIVDPDTPKRVARDAAKLRSRGLVQLCTTTDAWSPEAVERGLGRRCLEAILPEPGWSVRILTKSAAVVNDFDIVAQHRDRILVGISITAVAEKEELIKVIEPHASPISERMAAMRRAHELGLRTYAMLCPLLPGIGDSPDDIERLIDFAVEVNAEEVFVEPVNGRGNGLVLTEQALRAAGYIEQAERVGAIRKKKAWSSYVRELLVNVQQVLERRGMIERLRFLLYPDNLTEQDRAAVRLDLRGVRWLGKGTTPTGPE